MKQSSLSVNKITPFCLFHPEQCSKICTNVYYYIWLYSVIKDSINSEEMDVKIIGSSLGILWIGGIQRSVKIHKMEKKLTNDMVPNII